MTTQIQVEDRITKKPQMLRHGPRPELDRNGSPIFAIQRTIFAGDMSKLTTDLIAVGGSLQITDAFVTTLATAQRENLPALCVSGKPRPFFLRHWNGLWLTIARFALRRVRIVTKKDA